MAGSAARKLGSLGTLSATRFRHLQSPLPLKLTRISLVIMAENWLMCWGFRTCQADVSDLLPLHLKKKIARFGIPNIYHEG